MPGRVSNCIEITYIGGYPSAVLRCSAVLSRAPATRQPMAGAAHVAVFASVGYDVACGSSCAQNSAARRTTNGAPIMLISRPNVTQRAVMRVTLQGVGGTTGYF